MSRRPVRADVLDAHVTRTEALHTAYHGAVRTGRWHTVEYDSEAPARWIVTFYTSREDCATGREPIGRVTVAAWRLE